jgi:hypothetical protein
MFKRIAVRNMNEDYCPILHLSEREAENETPTNRAEKKETESSRKDLFVMAANIYFRARRNTRTRAAGII